MVSRSDTSWRARSCPRICSGVMSSAWTQRGDRLTDLAALSVRAGDVDEHPGLPFGGQPGGVHGGGGAQCPARVAQFDRDGDLVQPTLTGPNSVLNSLCPSPSSPGDPARPLKLAVGGVRVVDPGGDDGALQGQAAPQRHGLRVASGRPSATARRPRCGRSPRPGRSAGRR